MIVAHRLRCLLRAVLATSLVLWGAPAVADLRVAVASTVENTGLAAHLAAGFTRVCACEVRMLAAGSSQALFLAERGDVSAAITHVPNLERAFINRAGGRTRTEFMANAFILTGPAADPAQTAGLSLVAALRAIATHKALFLSRADGSGTNHAELALWQEVLGAAPQAEPWYREAGVQMAPALLIAAQTSAYTLSDSGTHAYLQATGVAVPAALAPPMPAAPTNVYSIVIADPDADLAHQFAAWLVSAAGRALIASYRVADQPLFTPLP